MPSPRAFAVLAFVISMLSCATSSQAVEYRSSQGFRLDYPSAWQVATKSQQTAVTDTAKQLLKNADFSSIDVLIYNAQSSPVQNVNVIVISGQTPTGERGLAAVKDALRDQLATTGMKTEGVESRLARVGNNDVIVSTWTSTMPAFNSPKMRQQQYFIPGHGRGYIVTCSTGADHVADAEPVFQQIMNSFQVDAAAGGTAGEWWAGQSSVVRGAIVGGVVGGVVAGVSALLAVLLKKGKRSSSGNPSK